MAILIEKLYQKFYPHAHNAVWYSLIECEDCHIQRAITKHRVKNLKIGHLCNRCSISRSSLGKKLSEETKQKIKNSTSGNKNHFFGKKHSEDTIKKMSTVKIGKKMSEQMKEKCRQRKGDKNPFFGKHHTEEYKKWASESRKGKPNFKSRGRKLSKENLEKLKLANVGKKHTEEHKKKMSIANSGENNPMYGKIRELSPRWNPNLTDEEREVKRNYPEYTKWCRMVRNRDNNTCILSGIKGKNKCHHLDGWNWAKNKRFDVNNGITLNIELHVLFHSIFGSGDNTKEQFEDFKLFYEEYKELVSKENFNLWKNKSKILCL